MDGLAGQSSMMVSPIFSLSSQYRPQDLTALATDAAFVLLGLKSGKVQRLDVNNPAEIETIPVVKPKSLSDTITAVFLSPTSAHSLIAIGNGDVYYLARSWTKPVKLRSLRNLSLAKVAWNPGENTDATGEFLLASSTGDMYTISISHVKAGKVEESATAIYSVRAEVTGLHLERLPSGALFVLVSDPMRLFNFLGRPGETLTEVFARCAASPTFFQLPGDTSTLAVYRGPYESASSSFAWATSLGVYHGGLSFANSSDNVLTSPSLLEYGRGSLLVEKDIHVPIAITITEFHFVLIFDHCWQAISRLSEEVVEEELFHSGSGRVLGVATDASTSSHWVYASLDVFGLNIDDESRHVWRLYLDKGLYESALEYAREDAQRDEVLLEQGKKEGQQGRVDDVGVAE